MTWLYVYIVRQRAQAPRELREVVKEPVTVATQPGSEESMFEDLRDAVSRLQSWRWPGVEGQVTAVAFWHDRESNPSNKAAFFVAYTFVVGDDGPYTGERDWTSRYYRMKHLVAARNRFRRGMKVRIKYRPDDPSVNKLVSPSLPLW